MVFNDYYVNNNRWWDEWTGHRNAISRLISDKILTKMDGKKSIAIFGAGHCNDLDLNYFTEKFDKVTLLDINKDIMREGIERQHITGDALNRIDLIGSIDFVGQTKEMYEEFDQMLLKKVSINELKKFINSKARLIERKNIVINGLEKHSVVVSVGVHSQLTEFMLILFSHFNDLSYEFNEIDELIEEIRKYYEVICRKYNDSLINYAEKAIFIGFDLIEISKLRNNEWLMPYALESVQKSDLGSLYNMMNEYKAGVSGSYEGLKDIQTRLYNKKEYLENVETKKIATNIWNWKFDKDKTYIVQSLTVFKECL